MDGFCLLLGHLVGDYIVQNDWMAKNKTAPYPRRMTADPGINTAQEIASENQDWLKGFEAWWLGHLACTVHCACYTLAVWAFTWYWMPWWGLLACFLIHWPVDRFRLANHWMCLVSGQEKFATGPLSPWSIIVVDNTFHLLTLAGLWWLAHL